MSSLQKTQPVIDYRLTEAERRYVAWFRKNTSNGKDWTGTIHFHADTNICQLSNHTKAGQFRK